MNNKIKVAVLGCTGYTGLELVYILNKHPNVIIKFLGSQNNSGKYINKFDMNSIDIRASNNNIHNKMLENLKNF